MATDYYDGAMINQTLAAVTTLGLSIGGRGRMSRSKPLRLLHTGDTRADGARARHPSDVRSATMRRDDRKAARRRAMSLRARRGRR
jgi:hypothetical protein